MRSVAIIGGGPAGLAAALAALDGGASVILIDSARDLGGQYWRSMPRSRRAADEARLHHGWSRFVAARDRVESSDACEVLTGAQVWSIEPAGQAVGQIGPAPRSEQSGVAINLAIGPADGLGQTMRRLTPDAVVLATGAHDRTLPFPGWELPGVFTGGAAQALAKSERVRVGDRVVVAGAGPFLLPVASSIVSAGGGVVGVFEASSTRGAARGWLRPAPWRLARTTGKFGELTGYAATFAGSRIPYRLGMGVVSAHGTEHVDAVTVARLSPGWHPIPGTERRIEVDAVCVSHGFMPRLELAIAAGCELTDDRFVAVRDDQQTSVPGVFAAGEITGIGGVDLAWAEGTIAGAAAAISADGAVTGPGDPTPELRRARRSRTVFTDFARRLDAAHGIPAEWGDELTDDTVICRCEEVTYGQLRSVAESTPSAGLRSLKLTTRVSLGPCQGRICGRNAEQLLARLAPAGELRDAVSTDRRPIVTPQRIGDLAALDRCVDDQAGSSASAGTIQHHEEER